MRAQATENHRIIPSGAVWKGTKCGGTRLPALSKPLACFVGQVGNLRPIGGALWARPSGITYKCQHPIPAMWASQSWLSAGSSSRLIINSITPRHSYMRVLRIIAAILLLAAAIVFTWLTIDGLSTRRRLRTELAEISHVRYGLLNADRWMEKIVPILEANIDALDLKAASPASLRPTVENALYRLLDDVKEKMSAKNSPGPAGGSFLGQGNALIVNLMVGALRPHVPEYADVVLAELGKPANKAALKKYLKSVLAAGATNTFGNVDMTWYSSILKQHGCADAGACQQQLGNRIREADATLAYYYL